MKRDIDIFLEELYKSSLYSLLKIYVILFSIEFIIMLITFSIPINIVYKQIVGIVCCGIGAFSLFIGMIILVGILVTWRKVQNDA